jgi:hypothetical protein
MIALGLTLALSAPAWAASNNIWQYNQHISIDMKSAKISHDKGMTVLTFKTVETADEMTDYCTYVYNVDDQTIQLKEMVTKTKKRSFKSNFYPESIKTGNNVIKGRAHMANNVLKKVEEMEAMKHR